MKERTMVFWVGLILFSLAAIGLFGIVWMAGLVMYPADVIRTQFLKGMVPPIVGGIVFLLIGVVMMRSGRSQKHEDAVEKLRVLPYVRLIGLASFSFWLGFWALFGYIYWKGIDQANLALFYVGVIFLTCFLVLCFVSVHLGKKWQKNEKEGIVLKMKLYSLIMLISGLVIAVPIGIAFLMLFSVCPMCIFDARYVNSTAVFGLLSGALGIAGGLVGSRLVGGTLGSKLKKERALNVAFSA